MLATQKLVAFGATTDGRRWSRASLSRPAVSFVSMRRSRARARSRLAHA